MLIQVQILQDNFNNANDCSVTPWGCVVSSQSKRDMMYIISRSKTAKNFRKQNEMIEYSNYTNFFPVKNIQELADISMFMQCQLFISILLEMINNQCQTVSWILQLRRIKMKNKSNICFTNRRGRKTSLNGCPILISDTGINIQGVLGWQLTLNHMEFSQRKGVETKITAIFLNNLLFREHFFSICHPSSTIYLL